MDRKYKNNTRLDFYNDVDVVPEDEIWVEVKTNSMYDVSNYGRVRNKVTGKLRKPFISNKGYLRTGAPNTPNMSNHRLVMENFHNTLNEKHIVNHKDGNKYNNHESNLEWVTHSENVKHAVDNDLRSIQSSIVLYDVKENKELKYKSLHRVSKDLGIAGDALMTYYKRSKHYPLLGRYVIKELNYTPLTKSIVTVDIYVYDYVDKKWLYFNAHNVFSLETGIDKTTVSPSKTKSNTKYVAGYYVCINIPKPDNIPVVSVEQAKADRLAYYSKPYVKSFPGYYVFDYETREERHIKNINDVANHINVDKKKILSSLGNTLLKGGFPVMNGYGIQPDSREKKDWGEPDKSTLLSSIFGVRLNTPIYYNVDTEQIHVGMRDLIKVYDTEGKYHNSHIEKHLIKRLIKYYGLNVITVRDSDIDIWKYRNNK